MSIRIELNDTYYIGSDADQYILYKKKPDRLDKKTGKMVNSDQPLKYWTRLDQLADHIAEFMARQESHTSLPEVKKSVQQWKDKINAVQET